MATDVDIANLALTRIGVSRRIQSLTENSPEAAACGFLYPLQRDLALASFSWPWATKRAKLALLSGTAGPPTTPPTPPPTEAPRAGWAYVYALPANCVTPLYIWNGVPNPRPEQRVPYAVELNTAGDGRVLLTDAEEPELVFVASMTAAGRYPALFVDALAWLLASELALTLRKDGKLASAMYMQWQVALGRAAAAALREGQQHPAPPPDFITARD